MPPSLTATEALHRLQAFMHESGVRVEQAQCEESGVRVEQDRCEESGVRVDEAVAIVAQGRVESRGDQDKPSRVNSIQFKSSQVQQGRVESREAHIMKQPAAPARIGKRCRAADACADGFRADGHVESGASQVVTHGIGSHGSGQEPSSVQSSPVQSSPVQSSAAGRAGGQEPFAFQFRVELRHGVESGQDESRPVEPSRVVSSRVELRHGVHEAVKGAGARHEAVEGPERPPEWHSMRVLLEARYVVDPR